MRTIVHGFGLVLFVMGVTAKLAAAQEASEMRRPPPEVAVSVGSLFPVHGDFFTDDVTETAGELRVTVPLTPRFAFEAAGTIGKRETEFFRRVEGFYMFQIKQRLIRVERGGFRPFLTYGVAGYYAQFSQPELHIPGPNGTTAVYPPISYFEQDEPAATLFGAGFQQRLSNRLAFRADAQLMTYLFIPLGTRYSVGMSLALGPGYSTN